MNRSPRLRLASLESHAYALLLTLGVAPQLGCASEVVDENAGGGGGSSSPAGTSGQTNGSSAAGTGGSGTGTGAGTGTSAGTGAGSSTATGTGGGATSTGTGGGASGCENPTPVVIDGVDTGFDQCAGGNLSRREALTCPLNLPGENPCCGGCPEGQFCSDSGEAGCTCVDACATDAECGDGMLCLCGSVAGQCVPAGCASPADCAPGELCTSWDSSMGCLYPAFACTTPNDSCGGDLDCPGAQDYCTVQADGSRACIEGGCAIGRPFLVDDEVRTAPVVARGDWRATAPITSGEVAPSLREELGAAWERAGQMEHASIAAFARFSLQLLALGAPPDLLERTHRALADETKHARMAFTLASHYRGRDVGPAPLAIDGALQGASDVATFVSLTVREGCVGETVAALEAAEGAARVIDPAVREVLGEIAEDEGEHAELAWRTVRWALATFGDAARTALAGEVARVRAELAEEAPSVGNAHDELLLRSGVTSARLRAGLRREALRRAVLPCLEALLADGASSTAATRGRGADVAPA